MSHFPVLIAIPHAENAADAESRLDDILEPYNENREVPDYVEWQAAEEVDGAVKFYRENPEFCTGDGGPVKPFDEFVTEGNIEAWNEWTRQAVGAYRAGGIDQGVYDPTQDRFGYTSTYNPDSKWDWWSLGGRWHGFFTLKPRVDVGSRRSPFPAFGDGVNGEDSVPVFTGQQEAILGPSGTGGDDPSENFSGRADLARKGDIDFEGMRTLAGMRAEQTYDKLEEATKGLDLPESFNAIRRRVFVENNVDPELDFRDWMADEEDVEVRRNAWQALLNKVRETYHAQPFIEALSKADLLGWFGDPIEEYCLLADSPREAYVEKARLSAPATFAAIFEGKWVAKGDMGWFGISYNETDENLWLREFNRRLDALPDDNWLAVVDCHI